MTLHMDICTDVTSTELSTSSRILIKELKRMWQLLYLCLGCPFCVSICTESRSLLLNGFLRHHVKQRFSLWTMTPMRRFNYLCKNVCECASPVDGESHIPFAHTENPDGLFPVLMGPA